MSTPSPKSPEQREKHRKYDRQLRLWGDHGQKLLENAKVCLINATALGTETLKSLVLPGIGAFTIVDGEKVTEEDVGSNFFFEEDSIGTSRAQAATHALLELNQDVRGDYIDESIENVMSHTHNFFKNFTVIIATSLPEKTLVPLSKLLWEADIPFLVGRSLGFFGYIRLQTKEHTVVETHPDNENLDLRLDKPWPALKEHLDKIDVESLDNKERSHVPALVILYYYMQKFRDQHGGKLPSNRIEKEKLRQMIREGFSPDEHGIRILEENYEQAINLVNTCVNPVSIPPNVKNILEDEKCTNLNQESTPFWIMAAALKEIVEAEGSLPLKGSLPDMAADTASYVTLQQLYQTQAQLQSETLYRHAVQIARSLGQAPDTICEADVKLFCKHSSEISVIRGSCIADEYEKNSINLALHLDDPENLIYYYIILKGLERFVSEYNVYPGQFAEQVEPDVSKLKTIIFKLLSQWGNTAAPVSDDRVHEMCRCGGAELHSVSAILAGCAAHEVIKVITHQYKVINNTFVYDAITSTSATFSL
ncbi:NEDD8-activating enzyme E1 regulatory subunit [Agrilus planipennis]|uniref:NEDD8-activating enzyme E1 regulatory subunit n=1 Tax=Agrilus planipennis TaxID=224129 RepID=A0A1W4WRX7_AGRPL|nr:NEDD8-activating enzyme E1 regulatory subunit [Agrilus planipennis]